MSMHETLAPWAEVVLHRAPMTVDELLALPDDGWEYELVEGRLVRMPPSGVEASHLAMRLGARLTTFAEDHALGIVTGTDGGFDLGGGTTLAPDVAFVRANRVLPRSSPEYDKAWPLAPDLVIEVASPNQYRPGMSSKARQYLTAGVRLVWIVWPKRREVDVWKSGDTKSSTTLSIDDTLDGGDIVPGFTYALARLFA